MLFFVAGEVTGEFSSVDTDEYIVVPSVDGLALAVPTVELAGAQTVEEEVGQVVTAN